MQAVAVVVLEMGKADPYGDAHSGRHQAEMAGLAGNVRYR
jgi:hypothetical protein